MRKRPILRTGHMFFLRVRSPRFSSQAMMDRSTAQEEAREEHAKMEDSPDWHVAC